MKYWYLLERYYRKPLIGFILKMTLITKRIEVLIGVLPLAIPITMTSVFKLGLASTSSLIYKRPHSILYSLRTTTGINNIHRFFTSSHRSLYPVQTSLTNSGTEGEKHIYNILTSKLSPTELCVIDISGEKEFYTFLSHIFLCFFFSFIFLIILHNIIILIILCLYIKQENHSSSINHNNKKKTWIIFLFFLLGGCGSMYAVNITSPKFRGLSLVKQHQLVNEALKENIKEMHGIQIKTRVSDSS